MKVVLAGGSGFLGQPLAARLVADGHSVVILTRGAPSTAPGVRCAPWTPNGQIGEWAREVDGADAIINLAGAGIADKRWSAKRKRDLKNSRVNSTRSLVAAVRAAAKKPSTFIQGSGAGYYGTPDDLVLDESFPPGSDFLAGLAVAWEAEAHPVTALGARLVIIRSGVVLAHDGGAFPQMARPFKFFVGGRLGSGKQYFAWIHRDDWIAMIVWALKTPTVKGVLNGTAPEPVTNQQLTKAIGHALWRPSLFPVPGFALKVIVGEMAGPALLRGQRVVPQQALKQGFKFSYPDIDSALAAVVRARKQA